MTVRHRLAGERGHRGVPEDLIRRAEDADRVVRSISHRRAELSRPVKMDAGSADAGANPQKPFRRDGARRRDRRVVDQHRKSIVEAGEIADSSGRERVDDPGLST